jgi:hypothetical protein
VDRARHSRRGQGSGPDLVSIVATFMIASVFFLIAASFAVSTYTLANGGQVVDASVLDKFDSTDRPGFHFSRWRDTRITVRFITKAGERVQDDTLFFVDHDPVVQPGDTIRVVYDPEYPQNFQDVRYPLDYVVPAILTTAGLVLVGVGLYELRHRRAARR